MKRAAGLLMILIHNYRNGLNPFVIATRLQCELRREVSRGSLTAPHLTTRVSLHRITARLYTNLLLCPRHIAERVLHLIVHPHPQCPSQCRDMSATLPFIVFRRISVTQLRRRFILIMASKQWRIESILIHCHRVQRWLCSMMSHTQTMIRFV